MGLSSINEKGQSPEMIRMNSVTSQALGTSPKDGSEIQDQVQDEIQDQDQVECKPDKRCDNEQRGLIDAYSMEFLGRRESRLSSDHRPFYISEVQFAALRQNAAEYCSSDRTCSCTVEDAPDFISRPSYRRGTLCSNHSDNFSFGTLELVNPTGKPRHTSQDIPDSLTSEQRQSKSEEMGIIASAIDDDLNESDVNPEKPPARSGETSNLQNRHRTKRKTMDTGRRKQCRFNETLRQQEIENRMKAYSKELEALAADLNLVKEELHTAARDGSAEKIHVLCRFLVDNGLSLCDEQMLGDTYQETALAVAVVKGSTSCAKVLVDFGGAEIVCKPYTTKQYAGVMPLHLAIIKQNSYLVEYMLNVLDDETKVEVINSKARGKYFTDKYSCPWVPLALAVGVGHIPIFDILLRHGANLMVRDTSTGDTVIHNLARVALKVPKKAIQTLHRLLHSSEVRIWFHYHRPDSEHNIAEKLLKTRNHAGYTPMSYAVCIGATQFAEAILDIEHVYTLPQWHVGPEQANLYEVSEIDPAVAHSNSNVRSVLEMHIFATSDTTLALGNAPIIRQTMENKWKKYKGWFIGWFVYHSLVMLSFTIYCTHFNVLPVFISLLEYRNESINLSQGTPQHLIFDSRGMHCWKDYTVQVLEIFVVVSALFFFGSEMCDMFSLLSRHCAHHRYHIRARGQFTVWATTQFDFLRMMLFVFSCCVPILFMLRLFRSPWQDVFYALAAVSGWTYMLFFVRALKNVGIFTAMMYRMILREVSYFLVLFAIGLVACGTGLYILFSLTPGDNPEEVHDIFQTFFTLFKVIVGLDEFQILEQVRTKWTAKLVFVFFVFFCHILLLNMLIAAMNNTYNRLSEQKEILWLQLRTKAVLMIERRLPRCLRPKHGLEQLHADREDFWYLGCEETAKDHPLTNFGFDDDVLSIK